MPGISQGTAFSPQTKERLTAFLMLLLLLGPLWTMFDAPAIPMDEGSLLVYPELILKGSLPYRDFETFYGPMNLFALAGAYAIFGVNIFVERSVGVLYHALVLLGIFALTKRISLTVAVGSMIMAAMFMWLAQVSAFAWLGGVGCLIWALLFLSKNGRWNSLIGGLLAAAALLYRPDLGPAVLLSLLPLMWRMTFSQRCQLATGFAVGVLPLFWLLLAAGFGPLLDNLVLYPVVYCNPARRLPLAAADAWIRWIFYLHLGACACNLTAGFLAWKKEASSAHTRLLLAIALAATGLTHQAIQRADSLHVVLTAFLSISLLPWSLTVLIRPRDVENVNPLHAFGALAAGFAAIALAAFPLMKGYALLAWSGVSDARPTGLFLKQGDRQFPFAQPEYARAVDGVLMLLRRESTADERLFVGPLDLRRAYSNDTFLYHFTPWLTPATYFLEMNPFSANRENSRLASDVASADWLVLNHLWDRWSETNEFGNHGPDAPNEVVRTQFELRKKFGPFEVYRRRGLAKTVAQTSEKL